MECMCLQYVCVHIKSALNGKRMRDGHVKRICRITGNSQLFVEESSPVGLCLVLLLFPVFRYQPRE